MIRRTQVLKVYFGGTEPLIVNQGEALFIRAVGSAIDICFGGRTVIRMNHDTYLNITNIESPGPGIVYCDRCKVEVGPEGSAFTNGYYSANGWGTLMNEGEREICDHCAWHDKRYTDIYGKTQCNCKKCKCSCQP